MDLQKKMSWEDLSEKKSPGENLPQFKMAPIHRVKSQELVGYFAAFDSFDDHRTNDSPPSVFISEYIHSISKRRPRYRESRGADRHFREQLARDSV